MGLLSVPLKTVLMYYATATGESIPESYAVCDGSTLSAAQQDINPGGTLVMPDLRNRFILGADITKAAGAVGGSTNTMADAPGPAGFGGVHSKSLVVAELASHSHTGTIATAGAHTHAGSTADSGGAHSHTASETSAGAHVHAGSTTSTAGAHTHSGTTLSTTGAHTHTVVDPSHSHGITSFVTASTSSGSGSQGYPSGDRATFTISGTQPSTTGITLGTTGDHTHVLTIASDGGHTHTISIVSDGSHSHTITVNSGGAHTHTLTLISDGTHTHTFAGDPTGSGQAWDTRPRYFGLVFIMKVKI